MLARVRESISQRAHAAATRGRPLRRRLKAGVVASETQTPHEDHDMDNASIHSTITVETTRTPTNENRKPTANPNLRPLTQVFCGLSDDPSLEPTEVLERAQSDITKLAIYMQQIQLSRPVAAAFMGLVRGDNRSWEAIAVDILRQKARWDNITLEDCEGEYLDTLLAFLFHLDNCAFLHLSNLILSVTGAWTLQSIVFCRNLSKLQLDLIDLSFAMPMLCRGLKSNMSLQCLIASRCGLNDDRLHELFTSLPKQLEELRIFGNKCREKGLAAITSVVHHSQHLRILDMSYQHVDTKNPNDGEFDVSWLAGALHHNRVLKVLDLDNDGIDDGHLTHLCAALCSNDTLEELMLNHNLITATGITLLSSKFGEMKGLKKISMYSNLFDAPEVDALVAENLQPTPREVEPVEEDSASDLEDDDFDEEIDYEEEIIVEESDHVDVVEDEDSSEGEMMSDNSSTPPPSADFREPQEAMDDSLPGEDQYSDDEADEGKNEESEGDYIDKGEEDEDLPTQADDGEAGHNDALSFPPSQIHLELPEQSQVDTEELPLAGHENGEAGTINTDEKVLTPDAPRTLHESADEEGTSPDSQNDIQTTADSPRLAHGWKSTSLEENGVEGEGLIKEDDGGEPTEEGDVPSLPFPPASEETFGDTLDKILPNDVANMGTSTEGDTSAAEDAATEKGPLSTVDTPAILEPGNTDYADCDIIGETGIDNVDLQGDEQQVRKDADLVSGDVITDLTEETTLDGSLAPVESSPGLEPGEVNSDDDTVDVDNRENDDGDAKDGSLNVASSSQLPTGDDNADHAEDDDDDDDDSTDDGVPNLNGQDREEVNATTHATEPTTTTVDTSSTLKKEASNVNVDDQASSRDNVQDSTALPLLYPESRGDDNDEDSSSEEKPEINVNDLEGVIGSSVESSDVLDDGGKYSAADNVSHRAAELDDDDGGVDQAIDDADDLPEVAQGLDSPSKSDNNAPEEEAGMEETAHEADETTGNDTMAALVESTKGRDEEKLTSQDSKEEIENGSSEAVHQELAN